MIKKLISSKFLVERLDCDYNNAKEELNFVVGQDNLKRFLPKPTDEIATDTHSSDEIGETTNVNNNNESNKSSSSKSSSGKSSSGKSLSSKSSSDKSSANKTLLKLGKFTVTKSDTTETTIKVKSQPEPKSKPKSKPKLEPKFKYTTDDFAGKTVPQLKNLAKDNNISATYVNETTGKKVNKTKAMLIDDLSAIQI
jgi:hypothetical protein